MNYSLAEASKQKYLILLFVLSTSFFIWQHAVNLSWDFTTYVSNARYLAGNGSYYEVSRPPLAPFLLFILNVTIYAEYIFIILVSLLFLYSTVRFADHLKISRELFYLFSLSPMMLFFGLLNGTELLSLALLELFLVFLLDKKPQAGIFLALACLTRYSFLIFLPLVFSMRYPRKPLLILATFLATLIPWLLYNFLTTGNLFTSIADSYALNFKYRYYFTQPVSYVHILTALSFLLPLFILGIAKISRRWKNIKNMQVSEFLCREKVNILLIIIFALSIYQYVTTPSKELRYLFPIALPVAYFSVIGISEIKKKSRQLFLAAVAIVVILNLAYFAAMNFNAYEPKEKYQKAVDVMHQKGIDDCRTLSNAWPLLNYLGKTTEPFPHKELLGKTIEEGNLVLFFYTIAEPEWATMEFLATFNKTYENDEFTILGGGCNPERTFNLTYVILLQEKILLIHNISINTNPCFVMFSGSEFFERSCNFINGKGFATDGNRISGLEYVRD